MCTCDKHDFVVCMLVVAKVLTVATMMHVFYAGTSTTCRCNIDHESCNNNKSCSTEFKCQRIVETDFVRDITIRDDQFCSLGIADDANCGHIFSSNGSFINFKYCCKGTDYCNTNNTAIDEFIRKYIIGTCVYMLHCLCLSVCQYVCVFVPVSVLVCVFVWACVWVDAMV